jgi:hypothetical protein
MANCGISQPTFRAFLGDYYANFLTVTGRFFLLFPSYPHVYLMKTYQVHQDSRNIYQDLREFFGKKKEKISISFYQPITTWLLATANSSPVRQTPLANFCTLPFMLSITRWPVFL